MKNNKTINTKLLLVESERKNEWNQRAKVVCGEIVTSHKLFSSEKKKSRRSK